MRARRLVGLCLSFVFPSAAGCTRESTPPSPSAGVLQPESLPRPTTTTTASASPPSSASPDAEPPRRFAAIIGSSCSAPDATGALCKLCDAENRVAGVIVPGDFLHVRGGRDVVHQATTGDGPRRLEHAVAVSNGALRAQILTCPGCRRQLGWAAFVSLDALKHLDPKVRADLQEAIGYRSAPLLDDEGAFRAAPIGSPHAFDCPGGSRR